MIAGQVLVQMSSNDSLVHPGDKLGLLLCSTFISTQSEPPKANKSVAARTKPTNSTVEPITRSNDVRYGRCRYATRLALAPTNYLWLPSWRKWTGASFLLRCSSTDTTRFKLERVGASWSRFGRRSGGAKVGNSERKLWQLFLCLRLNWQHREMLKWV